MPHPELAKTLVSLGSVLQAMGDLQGAKENMEKALLIFREKLGDTHPYSIAAENSLKKMAQA
jgi:hypothetical protein